MPIRPRCPLASVSSVVLPTLRGLVPCVDSSSQPYLNLLLAHYLLIALHFASSLHLLRIIDENLGVLYYHVCLFQEHRTRPPNMLRYLWHHWYHSYPS
jgi:hypothetical protein